MDLSHNTAISLIHRRSLSLESLDLEYYQRLQAIKHDQKHCIGLIAAENVVSSSIMTLCGSWWYNRPYRVLDKVKLRGGERNIRKLFKLCEGRLLEAFRASPSEWSPHVRLASGSCANFSAYTSLLEPGDKFMGLHLPCGGHLTHGFRTPTKAISATAKYFKTDFYYTDKMGRLVYDDILTLARKFKPKVLVLGYSALSQDIEWEKARAIADDVGAYLMGDISHFSGLVAGRVMNNPFEHCDLIMSTTHKSTGGPRHSIVCVNYKRNPGLDKRMRQSSDIGIHSMCCGATVAALCFQYLLVAKPSWEIHAKQIRDNAQAFCTALKKEGFDVVGDYTENHLFLLDLRKKKISGKMMQNGCDFFRLSVNMNTIPSDDKPFNPSGLRLGSPLMTTRGATEKDFQTIAQFISYVAYMVYLVTDGKDMTKDELIALLEANPQALQSRNYIGNWAARFAIALGP